MNKLIKKRSSTVTKDEIKTIIKTWQHSPVKKIAKKLNKSVSGIYSLAKAIRKCGYNLPAYAGGKKKKKQRKQVILEAIQELKQEK